MKQLMNTKIQDYKAVETMTQEEQGDQLEDLLTMQHLLVSVVGPRNKLYAVFTYIDNYRALVLPLYELYEA